MSPGRCNKKGMDTAVDISASSNKRVENSWVALLNEPLLQNASFSIITLPHPATGKLTKYCLDDTHCKIYEVTTFMEPCRSWFIQETVKSDGSLIIMTPIHPVFLVLSKLQDQCSDKAIPLEDLLSEKGFDKILDFVSNLDDIADLKGPIDLKAYKYNENKTLAWLEARVRKLATVLKNKKLHVTSGAVSATYVTSNINTDDIDEEFFLKYAHGLVSEYLREDLSNKLAQVFDFRSDLIETLGKKRKSEICEARDPKRLKAELSEDIENNCTLNVSDSFSDMKKQKPLSAKEKARQKAASGTKTISSFFSKK